MTAKPTTLETAITKAFEKLEAGKQRHADKVAELDKLTNVVPLKPTESVAAAAARILSGQAEITPDERDVQELENAKVKLRREAAVLAEVVNGLEGDLQQARNVAIGSQFKPDYSKVVHDICEALLALDRAMAAECKLRVKLLGNPLSDAVKMVEAIGFLPTSDGLGLGFLFVTRSKSAQYISNAVRYGHYELGESAARAIRLGSYEPVDSAEKAVDKTKEPEAA